MGRDKKKLEKLLVTSAKKEGEGSAQNQDLKILRNSYKSLGGRENCHYFSNVLVCVLKAILFNVKVLICPYWTQNVAKTWYCLSTPNKHLKLDPNFETFSLHIWGDFLSHNIFFAAEWQKWDFRSSRKTPIWTLIDINFVSFKNLGLVDLGFEVSKSQKNIFKGLRTLPMEN